MSDLASRNALIFSAVGHAYMHFFTAMYFVIAVTLGKEAWAGLTWSEASELWMLGAFLVGVAALPAGWLADRWSASGMMVVYFFGMGLCAIACALVEQPVALMLGLAGVGLFAAIYHPVGIPWVVRNAKTRRGKALGINGVFGQVGWASAGLITGILIDAFSWRVAFIVPGAICLSTGVLLLVLRLAGRVGEGDAEVGPKTPASRGDMIRVFAVLLLTMTVMGLVFQGNQAALPKLFDDRLTGLFAAVSGFLEHNVPGVMAIFHSGPDASLVGLFVALTATVGGIMQIWGGHLADRCSLKAIYLWAFLLQAFTLGFIAMAAGLPLVALSILAVALSSGALPAENILLARYAPKRHQAMAFGVKYVLAFGTAPIAISAAAYIREAYDGFAWLYVLGAVIAAAAALASAMLPRDTEPVAIRVPAE